MTQFVQLHALTAYSASNLNRDDLGRPKTATVGGVQRLRVSSQSLKRSWRVSELFEEEALGTRTRMMGHELRKVMTDGGMPEKDATTAAVALLTPFYGEIKKSTKSTSDAAAAPAAEGSESAKGRKGKTASDPLDYGQLAFFSHAEVTALKDLAATLAKESRQPTAAEIKAFPLKDSLSMDIAMFGRMFASDPGFNVEGAIQVAHAIAVEKSVVEDDYFTAVDDLNRDSSGAGMVGEAGFGSAVFYLYACINHSLLVKNLDGNAEMATRLIGALAQALATVSPSGKQNSFASRAYASYVLAEKGTQQPRQLIGAFVEPIADPDVIGAAIAALKGHAAKMNAVYDFGAPTSYEVDAHGGKGKFSELVTFLGA